MIFPKAHSSIERTGAILIPPAVQLPAKNAPRVASVTRSSVLDRLALHPECLFRAPVSLGPMRVYQCWRGAHHRFWALTASQTAAARICLCLPFRGDSYIAKSRERVFETTKLRS